MHRREAPGLRARGTYSRQGSPQEPPAGRRMAVRDCLPISPGGKANNMPRAACRKASPRHGACRCGQPRYRHGLARAGMGPAATGARDLP
ncbi:MAG: hypothetical protein ACK55I_08560, partial [bacterium]